MFGLLGSKTTSEAPVSASLNSTRCQVLPPSCVRYTPRVSEGPKGEPSAAANAMSGLVGWTIIWPIWPRAFQTCCQVWPASSDFQMPSPMATLPRVFASPEPT